MKNRSFEQGAALLRGVFQQPDKLSVRAQRRSTEPTASEDTLIRQIETANHQRNHFVNLGMRHRQRWCDDHSVPTARMISHLTVGLMDARGGGATENLLARPC